MTNKDRCIEYVDNDDCIEIVDPFVVNVDAICEDETWLRHPKGASVQVAKMVSPEAQGRRLQ